MIRSIDENIINKMIKDCVDKKIIIAPIKPEYSVNKRKASYGDGMKNDIYVTSQKNYVKCFCDRGRNEIQKVNDERCSYCGMTSNSNSFKILNSKMIKKMKEDYEKESSRRYWNRGEYYLNNLRDSQSSFVSRCNILKTYYVKEILGDEIGIDIVRVTIAFTLDKDEKLIREIKYDSFAEIIPGKKVVAYKETKSKGQEEIDFFDAFHITNDNVTVDDNVIFEGASSMIDFMANNEDFAKRTGFSELIKNYNSTIPENSLFLLYMYLYSEYPVVELLIKMGYFGLIFGLMTKICSNYRRIDIKQSVAELSNLLNQTTKGSASLTIPTYIGQFLNAKNAGIEEYMTWASLNEHKNISKENFEKYIASEAYWYLNYYKVMSLLPNIIKYGYELSQCSKYIMDQYFRDTKWKTKNNNSFSMIARSWKDYMEHCELMEIVPDKYPQDVIKAHDDIMVAYRAIADKEIDAKIKQIADKYDGYKTTSKYLDIIIPKSVYDFVTEGNNMHNCVGGYAKSVVEGRCRIFFIRRIDDMSSSYITAECTKNGLGQLFYRNNTQVTDYTEKEYAKAFCKYILSKGW